MYLSVILLVSYLFKYRVIQLITRKKKIIEITGDKLDKSVEIIRRAFGTVAEEMGITEEVTPFFPAFITIERLEELRKRGAIFFGLFIDGQQAGFVAVEKENDGKFYMKRLGVLPEFRHGGYGRNLVDTVLEYVKNKGSRKLHIAIVNEQTRLKDWYLGMGFKEVSIQKFEHLPFRVCFMELSI
jgi:ribosomal protein S18 acetylase RimI-like enzyme